MLSRKEMEYHVSRILSGYTLISVDDEVYKVPTFSKENRYRGQILYNTLMRKNSFEETFTEKDADKILRKKGWWSQQEDEQLQKIPENIENLKCDLYKAGFDFKRSQQIRTNIEKLEKRLESLQKAKHSLDLYTSEYHANTAMVKYLLWVSVVDINDNPIGAHDNFWDAEEEKIQKILMEYSQSKLLSIKEIRHLAKNDPWRELWCLSKGDIFEDKISEWSDERRVLTMYSKLFDNAHEHPEFPGEKILQDDYLFDGWMIFQKRKQEQDKKEANNSNMLGKHAGGGEIFLPAQNQEDAQRIYDNNDLAGKIQVRKRQAALQAAGKLKEAQLPDVKQKIHGIATEQFKNRVNQGKKS